jgi:hypothetical protein
MNIREALEIRSKGNMPKGRQITRPLMNDGWGAVDDAGILYWYNKSGKAHPVQWGDILCNDWYFKTPDTEAETLLHNVGSGKIGCVTDPIVFLLQKVIDAEKYDVPTIET